MTNREAYRDFMKIAKASLDKLDKMKGFITNDGPLFIRINTIKLHSQCKCIDNCS